MLDNQGVNGSAFAHADCVTDEHFHNPLTVRPTEGITCMITLETSCLA